MSVHVVGARGRLGRALVAALGSEAIAPPRAVYQDWGAPGGADLVADHLAAHAAIDAGTGGATLLVASGLLDPALPEVALRAVNLDLPVNVIAGAVAQGARVVTFGTVLEDIAPDANAYVRTKADLGAQVAAAAKTGADVLHLRIHTLFGSGAPTPFMFLGLMLAAIRARVPFEMTSGRQLREYHHVADEAQAILASARSHLTGVHDLSHGRPVTLASVARAVFDATGHPDMLRIGARPDPATDNFDRTFAPSPLARAASYRDTLPAIVAHIGHHA